MRTSWLNPILNRCLFQVIGDLQKLIKDLVDEHRNTFHKDDMRDFLDVYLKQITEEKDTDFNGKRSDRAEREQHDFKVN